MNAPRAIAFAIAAGLHAWLLWGWEAGTVATPLPAAEMPGVQMELVASPAEEIPPHPSAVETPPPSVEPTPAVVEPPPPVPEPVPAPRPEPAPRPTPTPAREKPAPPRTAPAKPASAPVKAAATATAPAATRAGATTGSPAGTAGAGNSPARLRSNPAPFYPPAAKAAGQQGRVILTVRVSANGSAESVTLKQSSGFPELDQAALAAVRRWRFEPARVAGIPVASTADVPVRFRIGQ